MSKTHPCPTCEEEITLPEGTVAAELVSCDECETMIEVVEGSDGFTLTEAPEVEEDWGE